MAYGTPTSQALTALSGAVATYNVPTGTKILSVLNRTGAGEVFLTVDGSTPVVGGPNQWFLPAAIASFDLPVPSAPGAEIAPTVALKAVSSAALSLWVSRSE